MGAFLTNHLKKIDSNQEIKKEKTKLEKVINSKIELENFDENQISNDKSWTSLKQKIKFDGNFSTISSISYDQKNAITNREI